MRGLCTLNILLTINDFSILITRDVDDAILHLIKDIYEHKCYQLKYIHSINKILFRSNIEANQFDLNGTFNVNVIIEADAEYFSYQESLMSMKVVKKGDAVVLKKDNAIALLRIVDGIDVKEGELFPIKIGKATMSVGNDLIKINAVPFIPTPVSTVIKLSYDKKNKPDALNALQLAMTNYTNTLSRISDMKLFTKVAIALYPYKDKHDIPCMSSTNVTLESLVKKCNNDAEIPKLDGMMLYSGDKIDIEIRKQGKISVIKKLESNCEESVEICSVIDGLIKICTNETLWVTEIINAIEFKLIENTSVMELYNKYKK